MEELKVPTQAVRVEVITDTGVALQGFLFVGESRYRTGRPEDDLIEVLNDERRFLPFEECGSEPAAQRPAILNKSHVVRVDLATDEGPLFDPLHSDDDDEVVAGGDTCSLLLTDGTCVMGRVRVEMPPSLSRLLDKLNHADCFLPVVDRDGFHFVNLAHVVHVA